MLYWRIIKTSTTLTNYRDCHKKINKKDNDIIGYFSDYLTNLLTSEDFLTLGGAIYIFSISIEMLNNATQDQEKEIIQLRGS